MTRLCKSLLLAALFSALPARADKLFVRNQPFKGATMGVGASRMVELQPLAQALGFTVKACNGGFLVTNDPKSDQGSEICEAGQAIVDGNKLTLTTGTGGETLVSLSEFCDSVGARLVLRDRRVTAAVLETAALGESLPRSSHRTLEFRSDAKGAS